MKKQLFAIGMYVVALTSIAAINASTLKIKNNTNVTMDLNLAIAPLELQLAPGQEIKHNHGKSCVQTVSIKTAPDANYTNSIKFKSSKEGCSESDNVMEIITDPKTNNVGIIVNKKLFYSVE